MKLLSIIGAAISVIASIALLASCSSKAALAGPNGGDVVPIQSGGADVKAEVVANADTGEVMVHTWDEDLEDARPIAAQPMTLGSGERILELTPHPLPTDPAGQCSRFYGQAEWIRGGSVRNGWLRCCGGQGARHDFAWTNCWSGGRQHDRMWSEMGEHRRGMEWAPGSGMGGHPGRRRHQ